MVTPKFPKAHPKCMADGDPPAHGVEANILHLLKISNSSISNAAHRPCGLVVRGIHLQRIFVQGFKFLFTYFKSFEDSAHLSPHAAIDNRLGEIFNNDDLWQICWQRAHEVPHAC